MYKEDKERQKLVLDTLEIALRDILVQQAGGASVADAAMRGRRWTMRPACRFPGD